MALTTNLTVVNVVAQYVDYAGVPIAGTVRFTPRSGVTDPAFPQIVIGNAITATLDAGGNISIYLPATDDSRVIPTGFTYLVEELFNGGRTFDMGVPAATIGTLNVASVVAATASAGTASLYVSFSQYASINSRVTVLEGYASTLVSSATAANASAVAASASAASAATAATNSGTASSAATVSSAAATTTSTNVTAILALQTSLPHDFLLAGG
jgi:hypothetical protein